MVLLDRRKLFMGMPREVDKVTPAQSLGRLHLTPLELSVIQWYANGKLSREIADLQDLTLTSVYQHIFRIKNATGTNTIAGAVAFCMRRGLIR